MPELLVGFLSSTGSASISIDRGGNQVATDMVWAQVIRLAQSVDANAISTSENVFLSWPSYLQAAQAIRHLVRANGWPAPKYSGDAEVLIRRWVEDLKETARNEVDELEESYVLDGLARNSWDFSKRRLTPQQLRDIRKSSALRHSAVFSVPGAGKTTVALALHKLLQIREPSRLLVIAPKNAFGAWDDVITDCLVDSHSSFTRLTGGEDAIRALLRLKPNLMIISYQQLVRVSDLLVEFVIRHPTHIVLDESHRIKAGSAGQTSVEVLRLAPFAVRRDVLSGTPMPQAQSDLEPQFQFLFPASDIARRLRASSNVAQVIGPLFVRTRYSELGVPRPNYEWLTVEMSDSQRVLYGYLADQVVRQSAHGTLTQPLFRSNIFRLMMAAIDPQAAAESLLASGLAPAVLRDICRAVLEEGLSPRLAKAIEIARASASEGKKIVLWAPFSSTLERLSSELSELGARVLYGATPTGDPDEDGTREQIIQEFHRSSDRMVLIANPQAGGEGISLHKVCHHALYVGRTFNAKDFLQSRDRINRLGLPPGVTTQLTFLESLSPARLGSVDLSIRRRLKAKEDALGRVLDDPDLQELAGASDLADPTLEDDLTMDDLRDLVEELTKGLR